MTKGDKVVQFALTQVGTEESPAGTNHNPYGKWFGFDGVAWCAEFVSYCYAHAGFPLGKLQYSHGIAGVQWAVANASKFGRIVSKDEVRPGDAVCFDWNGDKRYDHIGFFNGWIDKAKGTFYTIEGNTAKGNDSNGGKVMNRNDRHAKNVVFIHPNVLD